MIDGAKVLTIGPRGKGVLMNELPLSLSYEERKFLGDFLERAQKEARVEVHRTRNLSYREHLVQREQVIAGLLNKLGTPSPWEEVGI